MNDAAAEIAPAKINLYLHVVGKRPDGYHLLDSLAVFVDIADMVTASPAPSGSDVAPLTISGPFARPLMGEPPGRNLALRAVYALAACLGRAPDAAIALEKNLPVASGIGGGSADAAAALRALAHLWRIDINDPRLYMAAAGLGADAPVCLAARPCFMAGVGEVLKEAPPLPPTWIVLVNPGVGVSTPAVFKARRGDFSQPAPFTESPSDFDHFINLLSTRRNDLTEPARFHCPVIHDMLTVVAQTAGCRLSRMSGSGATCFGLYADEGSARAAAAALTAAHPEWWSQAGRILPRPVGAPPLPDPDFFNVLLDEARKIDMAPPLELTAPHPFAL